MKVTFTACVEIVCVSTSWTSMLATVPWAYVAVCGCGENFVTLEEPGKAGTILITFACSPINTALLNSRILKCQRWVVNSGSVRTEIKTSSYSTLANCYIYISYLGAVYLIYLCIIFKKMIILSLMCSCIVLKLLKLHGGINTLESVANMISKWLQMQIFQRTCIRFYETSG
jgi:hypothetical protein